MVSKIICFFKKFFKGEVFDYQEKLLAYISGKEIFPEALDEKEENELLRRLKDKDIDAQNELIEHNLRLVVYIAKKFESTTNELEDLISVGAIGLIKAVKSFDADKNIKLATYASRCIENEILMHMRKKNRQSGEISIDEPLNFDKDGNELLLSDILEGEDESKLKEMEKMSENQVLWSALQKLNLREQQIMKLRFGLTGNEERTQKEVADSLGISQSYISRIEKKILNKLKKDISKTSFF